MLVSQMSDCKQNLPVCLFLALLYEQMSMNPNKDSPLLTSILWGGISLFRMVEIDSNSFYNTGSFQFFRINILSFNR